ncbi:hypothetical protein [Formosa algae]|uniref:hypothetical protein n=1 Tax=Formosa algae TaxID=225843 RepID=UPI0026C54F0B|nr:hypothetical protein [Formosa algae]
MIYRKAIEKDVKSVAELFNAYRVFYKKEADLKQAEHFILERLQNNDSEIFIAEKRTILLLVLFSYFLCFLLREWRNYGC